MGKAISIRLENVAEFRRFGPVRAHPRQPIRFTERVDANAGLTLTTNYVDRGS